MLLGALVSLAALIYALVSGSQLRDALVKAQPDLSRSDLDHLVTLTRAITVVTAIVFVVLYALLALQVRRGKNWARIVTLVLAVLGVLNALASFAQHEPVLTLVIAVVQGLIDAALIGLLGRGEGADYFAKRVY